MKEKRLLERKLKKLKKEQSQAFLDYNYKVKNGAEVKSPNEIKQLAKEILDRKEDIDKVEAQIKKIENEKTKFMLPYPVYNSFFQWIDKMLEKEELKFKKIVQRVMGMTKHDWNTKQYDKMMYDKLKLIVKDEADKKDNSHTLSGTDQHNKNNNEFLESIRCTVKGIADKNTIDEGENDIAEKPGIEH